MRRALVEEQRALSSDVEGLFRAYDAKLRSLSGRLNDLDDEALAAEADEIAATQDALKRMVRRVEASVKASRDLERELAEWENRPDSASYHADHPEVRAELIRSELASRNPGRSVVSVGAYGVHPVRSDEGEGGRAPRAPTELDEEPSLEAIPFLAASDPLPEIDVACLLQAIREATREAERWHAVPSEEHDEDALLQLHHLRDLHAALKRVDREQGVHRDRLALAVNTHDIH